MGENIPNDHKIYQMAIKYFQWPQNRPNYYKIFQDFPLQDPPKLTQIGILGLKNKPSGNPDWQRGCSRIDYACRAMGHEIESYQGGSFQ
jgi:hypothetical protein